MKETFENLFNKYFQKYGVSSITSNGHELVDPHGELKVRSDEGFKIVKVLSRHKTPKPLIRISCSSGNSITVTTDHICMAYNDDNMLENTAGKDLRIGMSVVCNENGKKRIHTITKIEELGTTDEYVYDLEVEDDSHIYYANDILVHNSIFLNLDAVTRDFASKRNIKNNDLNNWNENEKMELWDLVSGFVDNSLIPSVQSLVSDMCKTNNASVLRYGLEYIGSGGIYESKKHYGVHKVIDEGPELVDKFKFTGIEIKKATVPPEIKKFLKDIYCKAIIDESLTDEKMIGELRMIYNKVKAMNPNEIGKWMGYSTERQMGDGFLNAEKGMTGISKAVGYYNQIAEDMGISKKYGTIELGEKVQTVYVNASNKYGIDVIAFKPRNWPVEFDNVFEIDKPKMFDKLIMSPLKNFFTAMKFEGSRMFNPAKMENLAYSLDDL